MTSFNASALISLNRVTTVAASPDGTWVAVAVQRLDDEHEAKYVGELWRVPLDGGEPTQLTQGKWNDHSPAFRHDGALLFLSNRPTGRPDDDGHDKRAQVFAFGLHGEEPTCITDEPLGVQAFTVAKNADVMAVEVKRMNGVALDDQRKSYKERSEHGPSTLVYDEMPVRFWDHWLPNEVLHVVAYVGGERARDLTPDAARLWSMFPRVRVSADGSFAVINEMRRGTHRLRDNVTTIVDIESGERHSIETDAGVSISWAEISPDGTRLAVGRSERVKGRFGGMDLYTYDIATRTLTQLDFGLDTDLAPICWTEDGERILVTGPWRTQHPVWSVDAASGELTRIIAEDAGGVHNAVVCRGDTIFGVRSTLTQPPEVFRCDVRPEAQPQVLTNLSGFDSLEHITTEYHTVESTDGAPVQYHVVRRTDADGPQSCIFAIHGGPIGDWGDTWHWRWNALSLADSGHVVVLPNPRGSTGFGQEFIEGIWNNSWGGQCYEDLMCVADEVEARPDVDERRIIAMGGSFGGYMTNWIGTQTDRFCGLITHASIFDMRAFHGVTDMPAWWAYSFGVEPYAEREQYDRYSPIHHVQNWKSPTLIIHGDRDYRVPIGEALSLFEALKHHEVDAKLVIFPDENHWILKPRNIVSWYEHVLSFIDEHAG